MSASLCGQRWRHLLHRHERWMLSLLLLLLLMHGMLQVCLRFPCCWVICQSGRALQYHVQPHVATGVGAVTVVGCLCGTSTTIIGSTNASGSICLIFLIVVDVVGIAAAVAE